MQIFNFGSRYLGWKDDILRIFRELEESDRWASAIPTIKTEDLQKRLQELPYCAIIDRLQIEKTVSVFGCSENDSEEAFDNWINEELAKAEDAPLGHDKNDRESSSINTRDLDGGFDEDFPPRQNKGEDAPPNTLPSKLRPRYADSAPGGPGQPLVEITVDCYGIYVVSLKYWLDKMINFTRTRAARELYQQLQNGKIVDGPAVLLCPELMDTASQDLMNTASLRIRRALSITSNPTSIFLKLTLLHEVGHHIFPVHGAPKGSRQSFLSEALANWFAYNFVGPFDRAILLEESASQSREYRAYQGLIWLEHGPAFLPACCGPTQHEWIRMIERASFNKKLVGPSLESDLKKYSECYDYSFECYERFCHRLESPYPGLKLHQAQVYSWILVRQSADFIGERLINVIRHFYRRSASSVISKKAQREWFDISATLPRRIPSGF